MVLLKLLLFNLSFQYSVQNIGYIFHEETQSYMSLEGGDVWSAVIATEKPESPILLTRAFDGANNLKLYFITAKMYLEHDLKSTLINGHIERHDTPNQIHVFHNDPERENYYRIENGNRCFYVMENKKIATKECDPNNNGEVFKFVTTKFGRRVNEKNFEEPIVHENRNSGIKPFKCLLKACKGKGSTKNFYISLNNPENILGISKDNLGELGQSNYLNILSALKAQSDFNNWENRNKMKIIGGKTHNSPSNRGDMVKMEDIDGVIDDLEVFGNKDVETKLKLDFNL